MASRFTVFKKNSWRVDMRGWPFVIVVGLILAAIAVIDGGSLAGVRSSDTVAACSFTVNGTDVFVRRDATTASSSVQKLDVNQRVVATPTLTNGFRRLDRGGWVSDTFLTPVVGNTCA